MIKDFVVFDWEVFPHWNCIVWAIYGTNECHVITSDDIDYKEKLRTMAYSGYLSGFNIKGYDMQMTDFAIAGYTPEELYAHNQLIIESEDSSWKSLSFWRKFEFTDLFDDLKTMGSLKQFESNTGLPIHESDVPFGKENLTDEEKQSIIKYCIDDVKATCKLLEARMGYISAKATCSKLSPLSEAECLKNTSAKLCAKMLGAKKVDVFEDRVYEIPEKLKSLFEEYIHPTILENFIGQPLVNDFSYEVRYMKNSFVYGAGGVHSTYKDSLYYISDDEYMLVNADFENLYPSLLVVYNYYSAGVPASGKELFKFLLAECRRLKAELRNMRKAGKGDTQEYDELFKLRDAIKLILNASTGAMRSKFSPLYDPQQIIALCMTGQLLTTCMARIAHLMGALIIQTNTDGVLFRIKRSDYEAVRQVLLDFSAKVEIPLEIDEEYSVFQKNVNNYILYSEPNGKPKLKGRWAKKSGSDVPLVPLNAPVINNAVIAYYSKGIPFEETIKNETNPLNFMMTTMKGPTYNGVLYQSELGEHLTTNINRVYATTNTAKGTLYKYKVDETGDIIKRDKIASIPEHCSLWNDQVPPEVGWKYGIHDIDYDWYIAAARKSAVDMEKLA
jgi:hypothetical protein